MITIVDDDASVRKALIRLFKAAGYQVQAFESSEAFLLSGALAQTQCLVLDVHLPKMNGLELQRQLVDERLTCPTVFISAFDDEDTRQMAVRNGAIGFLGKPVDVDHLLSLIEQSLE